MRVCAWALCVINQQGSEKKPLNLGSLYPAAEAFSDAGLEMPSATLGGTSLNPMYDRALGGTNPNPSRDGAISSKVSFRSVMHCSDHFTSCRILTSVQICALSQSDEKNIPSVAKSRAPVDDAGNDVSEIDEKSSHAGDESLGTEDFRKELERLQIATIYSLVERVPVKGGGEINLLFLTNGQASEFNFTDTDKVILKYLSRNLLVQFTPYFFSR